eukprot:CAMPEP_0172057636 /NCGR_PEP_ID=MMETSP1043-20130122/6429_1 /TAXON_ID=464988 /ORGANISM="Hemiselmis andersenii, Strain CCMP441" /LENGTH=48 /DNA_ID= /DNA_START= /DNA_END= /DNA_ORIENTATION=
MSTTPCVLTSTLRCSGDTMPAAQVAESHCWGRLEEQQERSKTVDRDGC